MIPGKSPLSCRWYLISGDDFFFFLPENSNPFGSCSLRVHLSSAMRKASFPPPPPPVLFIGTASLNREKKEKLLHSQGQRKTCVEGRQRRSVSHRFIMRCQLCLSLQEEPSAVETRATAAFTPRKKGERRDRSPPPASVVMSGKLLWT